MSLSTTISHIHPVRRMSTEASYGLLCEVWAGECEIILAGGVLSASHG